MTNDSAPPNKKTGRRRVGLYQITTESVTKWTGADPAAQIEELQGALQGTPALPRFTEWLRQIHATIEPMIPPIVLDEERTAADTSGQKWGKQAPDTYPPEVMEFVYRCRVALARVHMYLRLKTLNGDEVAGAMEAAAELADEWHSLTVQLNIGPRLEGAMRVLEKQPAATKAAAKKNRQRGDNTAQRIRNARDKLPPRTKSHEVIGKIAKSTGIPESTVRSHLRPRSGSVGPKYQRPTRRRK